MNSFLSPEELAQLGLKSYGAKVLISRKASFYGAEHIVIGDNVRIDDFCVLSGDITIGRNVHIAPFCLLMGKCGIKLGDFVGLSSRVSIYSASDDFSGAFMTNPTVPTKYTNISGGKVCLKRHVLIGANVVVFPKVTINEGAAIGAMSQVSKDVPEWVIAKGIPLKIYCKRDKTLLSMEKKYLEEVR